MPRAERFPKARAAAIKALEIDDTLGEAHAALAEVEVSEWNWPAAELGFKAFSASVYEEAGPLGGIMSPEGSHHE